MSTLNKLAAQLRKIRKQETKAKQEVIALEQELAEAKARVLTLENSYHDTFNEIILEASAEEESEEEAVEVETEGEGGLSAEGVVVTEKPAMPEEIKKAVEELEATYRKGAAAFKTEPKEETK